MAKRNISNEMKVGILVVVSIAVLLGLLYKTGSLDFKREGYTIKATFSIVAGVQRNAPVRLAGVEIGKVEDIKLSYEKGITDVIVSLWLDNNAKLKTDSKAIITALGLMGEKYIEVTAGSEDAPYLAAGGTILGEDPLQFDSLAKKGEVIAKNLDETLSSIQELAKNTNLVVTDNKQKIGNIFDNLEVTTQNMKEFTEDIKRNPWKLMNKGK
ncbi:MAG: MlaD family protein [Candidatus Omnitrophica bacterium]|nr:MlaD family protein [Candidatus Omnitrophota bacterium]